MIRIRYYLLCSRSYSAEAATALKPMDTTIQRTTLPKPQLETAKKTFYRRNLPPYLHSFTSSQGKALFRESLAQGYAENYFQLVGNFTTQSEPAFCGLGSLAMVLNALEMDPGKQWKGVWRWYADDNLECCSSNLDIIKKKGITFREFSCLAKCNGLNVTSKRADMVSKSDFISDLKTVCSRSDVHMVVSFSRNTLGQTGDGHFSPIGSYNHDKNMALVLDTARFKYPSYYAPVDLLYNAMRPVDKETGMPRGYFLLSRDSRKSHLYKRLSLCKLTKSISIANPSLANLFCSEIPKKLSLASPHTLSDALKIIFDSIPAEYSMLLSMNEPNSTIDLAAPAGSEISIAEDLVLILNEVAGNPLYNIIYNCTTSAPVSSSSHSHSDRSSRSLNAALATIFILSTPRQLFRTLSPELIAQLDSHRDLSGMSSLLKLEIEKIADQLSSLTNDNCQCIQKQHAYSQLPSFRLAACLHKQ